MNDSAERPMADDVPRLANAELFHTELTPARAVAYARLEGAMPGDGFTLSGWLYGPLNKVTQSLAARHKLQDLGPGTSLLARAIIPDPVLWTAQTPALYEARLELKREGQLLERSERLFALRGLGISGSSLIREGKRWVLRGATSATTEPSDLAAWRASGAACLAYQPPPAAELRRAAEQGVLLATRIQGGFAALLEQLRGLAQWPAVGIVLLPAQTAIYPSFDLQKVAPNLLLGCILPPDASWQWISWAHLVVAVVEEPAQLPRRLAGCQQPVICLRPSATPLSIESARAECDRLQRDLAPYGQFAGYLV